MEYAIVTVPAAPVRRKPKHQAEMVNQLLFGEAVKILKAKNSTWIKVRSLYDDYEGWLTYHMIYPVKKSIAENPVHFVSTDLLAAITVKDVQMHIPAGSSLRVDAPEALPEGERFPFFNGTVVNTDNAVPSTELVLAYTKKWLNAPYMWGGRTPLGVDCSGFAQVIYKQMGIKLPRDAWQQAQGGQTIKKLKDATTGDLAFFDDKDEIVHVGILLSPTDIIHAAGKVRIDTIDKDGIINVDTGKRTHSLRAIKRFWGTVNQ
ncbi:NlpC/P60 family protein [Terrimonas rubra]|uniref:NlpC/P60 family protein n=1 Tax=Terrimonas rubra TaxID=1035890 RepID=A0ABW6A7Z0_9BACT